MIVLYVFIISLIYLFSFLINANSNLNKLTLPQGFKISIYADNLDSPRQITETEGFIVVGSKNGNKILALNDKDKDGFVDEKIIIASGLQNPTGVTYHKGDLYFAEIENVWMIKDIDDWLLSPKNDIPLVESYISDLPSETWHGFRHIRFGPDNNLYIPIGVPCNICIEPQTKDQRFAAIHRYENNKLVMVADGVRNSVGIDWHPVTKNYIFLIMEETELGDNSPSCELNVVKLKEVFLVTHYKHAKNVIDPEFGKLIPTIKKNFVDPIAELGPGMLLHLV